MIELTKEQRKVLDRIWGIYGNNGRKCTLQNHKLIQGFLHYNEDRRAAYIEGNKNMKERYDEDFYERHKLTNECLKCVNFILDNEFERAINLALDKGEFAGKTKSETMRK